MIHRDLKPSNLQLTSDGLLKILDFGVARLERADPPDGGATATETGAGEVLGSPPYMAPEQVLGKAVDERTDLLYELATGKRPYGEKRGAALTEVILHEAPVAPRVANPRLSAGLEAVILKALDKDPGLRYQTAKELLVDLERLQAAATSGAASQPVAVRKPRQRWSWLVGSAALVVIAAGAWFLRPLPAPRITNVRPLRLDLGWYSTAGIVSTWATDGLRLYYVVRRQGEYRLMQVAATGGEPSEIGVPEPLRRGFEIYGFLRDPSALLCLAVPGKPGGGWPVWLVPVPQGTPRQLAGLTANWAAASPDGQQIALLNVYERQLVWARADGSATRVLTGTPPGGGSVIWSPEGHRIRFSAQAEDQAEPWIWETTAEGGTPRPLWPGRGGAWTADARLFVFERWNEAAKRFDLFTVRERPWRPWTRPQPVALTTGPLEFTGAGVRPDGGGLFALGADRRGELLRFDAASRRFVSHLDGVSVVSVDTSRDGQWLAWTTWPEGSLWRSRADGTQKVQLTPTGLWAGLPRWSPDGKRIAFTGQPAPRASRAVSVVSAEGGNVEVLATPEPGLDHWDVCWLPDGRSLVFSYLRQRMGLFRVDLATRQVSPWPGAEGLRYPKCSPQGRIFALAIDHMDHRVFLPERRTWEPVAVPGYIYANWTRDGQALVGYRLPGRRIERFSLATRRSEVVADLRGLALATQEGVGWIGLDGTDTPLVTRDATTVDLYALDWEAP